GKVFGSIQNNPWVMLGVANVILVFALSMLDVFTLPSFGLGQPVRQKGGWGIFLIGLTSGFMVSPCTAPVLGTLLLHITTRQNILWGVVLLFIFSVGSGTSLVLAGTFSGFLASLPKAGIWMVRIKKATGFILLALAEYYVIKAGQLFL
ncbi:MAG: sulfite exporter TauE/SafE family protein, partial [Candidatus Omnitrophica bacterium]|nr:sulfite exporter TauE/SafE family protein [Candidatus Omnitrophota bacterium]